MEPKLPGVYCEINIKIPIGIFSKTPLGVSASFAIYTKNLQS